MHIHTHVHTLDTAMTQVQSSTHPQPVSVTTPRTFNNHQPPTSKSSTYDTLYKLGRIHQFARTRLMSANQTAVCKLLSAPRQRT